MNGLILDSGKGSRLTFENTTITGAGGHAVGLQNVSIDGASRAGLRFDKRQAGNLTARNLSINDTAGDGISFDPVGTVPADNSEHRAATNFYFNFFVFELCPQVVFKPQTT